VVAIQNSLIQARIRCTIRETHNVSLRQKVVTSISSMPVSFRSSLLLARSLNSRRNSHLEQPSRWSHHVLYTAISRPPGRCCSIMAGSYQQQHRHNVSRRQGTGQSYSGKYVFVVLTGTTNSYPCFSTSHQRYKVGGSDSPPSHEGHEDYHDNDNDKNRPSVSSHTRENLLSILEDTTSYPPGSMTRMQIKDAEKLLDSFASERHSKAFTNALFVLNRLAQEQEFYGRRNSDRRIHQGEGDTYVDTTDGDDDDNNDYYYQIRPYILNRVLDCWRRGYRDGLTSVKPAEVIALVDDLEARGVVIPDSRSLTLIVDGICLGGAHGRRQQRRQKRHQMEGDLDNNNNSNDVDRFQAPLLAQWLFDRRMEQAQEDETLRPDTVLLTNIIRAWAQSGRMEAPEMADGILELMHDLYNKGWVNSGPNTRSYGVTMEAWSKSRHPNACNRIDDLLQEMKDSNLQNVLPDRISYQYALNGWANSGTRFGANRACNILQEMVVLYNNGNDLVAPNVSNFTKVMIALARLGDAGRVESLLEQLQGLHSASGGDRNFQPNDDCWTAYIIAQSKAGAVEEAHATLDEMVERAWSMRSTERMPRRSHFVDVLVAWTKHRNSVLGAEMSQKVLDRMVQLYSNGYRDLMPDSKSYDRVILAWSRSRQRDAPEKIEYLLEQMELQCTTTSIDGYTNLMLSWLRSGRGESTDAIQRIYESLRERCWIGGSNHLCPDKFVFGVVIDSWVQKGKVAQAELIFEEMMNDWKHGGNAKAKPDAQIFEKMLNGWSVQKSPQAVGKCLEYMSFMKENRISPTFMAHTYLIDVLSGSTDLDAEKRASAALEDLVQCVAVAAIPSPRYKEYRLFLELIAKSSIPRRNQQARELLQSLPWGKVPEKLLL
jgi:hypothetical protein